MGSAAFRKTTGTQSSDREDSSCGYKVQAMKKYEPGVPLDELKDDEDGVVYFWITDANQIKSLEDVSCFYQTIGDMSGPNRSQQVLLEFKNGHHFLARGTVKSIMSAVEHRGNLFARELKSPETFGLRQKIANPNGWPIPSAA